MASNLMGLAFVPYYKHLMELLETNAELKKTSKGMSFFQGNAQVDIS